MLLEPLTRCILRSHKPSPPEPSIETIETVRPLGHTNPGQLFQLSSPLATKSETVPEISATDYLHDTPEEGNAQLTTVLSGGARYFLRTRPDVHQTAECKHHVSGNLLSMPMSALSREADKLYRHILTAQNKSKSALDTAAPLLANQTSLWVDKYSPKSFSHLLSSEKTNREVLRALKQWDPFVFKSKSEIDDKRNKGDTRPAQKVLLLCGPPGTGKVIPYIIEDYFKKLISILLTVLLFLYLY